MRAFCHTRKSIICALSLNKVNMLVNYLDEPLIGSLHWFTEEGTIPLDWKISDKFLMSFNWGKPPPPLTPQLSQHHPYLSVCLSSLYVEGDYMYIQNLSRLSDERGGWTN
jgi:hypothetical protein